MSVSHVEQKAKLERALARAKAKAKKQDKLIETQRDLIRELNRPVKKGSTEIDKLKSTNAAHLDTIQKIVERSEKDREGYQDHINVLKGDVHKQFLQLDDRRVDIRELNDTLSNRDAEITRLYKAAAYQAIELSNK